jgi:hypothetical protein
MNATAIADEPKVGPISTNFLTLVLKTFAGLGGGIVGTIILFGFFLLGSSVLQPVISGGDGEIPSLFVFLFIAMIFLTSLGSNIVGAVLFSLVQNDKYGRPTSALTQIFILNLVIVGIMAPIYIVTLSLGLELMAFVAGIHVMVSALGSAMTLEIIGNMRYAMLGVYSSIFSVLFATGVIFLFYQFTGGNLVIILFAALPLIWMFLGFIGSIVEIFYLWLYRLYGSDFLSSSTDFGKEYGESEEEEEREDVAGADFLGKD